MRTLLLLCAVAAGTLALTPDEIRQFKARDVVEQNTGMKGSVTVSEGTDTLTIVSNGIPDHATAVYPNPHNPNSIVAQNFRLTVPKDPQVASQTTCLPMGPVGVAINGVPIFNPYTHRCTNAAETEVFDECDGHPSPQGEYHYHIHPDCVFDGTANHSQIVGVAADGFAIYGPVDDDGTVLTNADLDECHGRMKDGVYRYHVTAEYPFFMACFKGTVRSDSGINTGRCQCTVDSTSTNTGTLTGGTGPNQNPGGDSGGSINQPFNPWHPLGPHHPPQGPHHPPHGPHRPPHPWQHQPHAQQSMNAISEKDLTYQDFLQFQQWQQMQQWMQEQQERQQPVQDETAPQQLLQVVPVPVQPLTLYQIWQQHQPPCREHQMEQWQNFQLVFRHYQKQQQALNQAGVVDAAAPDQQLQQVVQQPLRDDTSPQQLLQAEAVAAVPVPLQPLTLYQIWQQHQPSCREYQMEQWQNFQLVFRHYQKQQQALNQAAVVGVAAPDQQLQQVVQQPLCDDTGPQQLLPVEVVPVPLEPLTLFQIWQQHQPSCRDHQMEQWENFQLVFRHYQKQQQALNQAGVVDATAPDQQLQQVVQQPLRDDTSPQHLLQAEAVAAVPVPVQPLTLFQIWQQHQPSCRDHQMEQWQNFQLVFRHYQKQQQALALQAAGVDDAAPDQQLQQVAQQAKFRPRAPFPTQ